MTSAFHFPDGQIGGIEHAAFAGRTLSAARHFFLFRTTPGAADSVITKTNRRTEGPISEDGVNISTFRSNGYVLVPIVLNSRTDPNLAVLGQVRGWGFLVGERGID